MSEQGEHYRWLKIVLFLVLPLTLVVAINVKVDMVKPIWFDEMVVSRTALQPDLSSLWHILVSGQSPHPPLNFLAVRAAYAVFGVHELSTRLPATIGFTMMEVCLFFFIAKRSSAAFGAVGMLLPLVTAARTYAVEAKPYGALLGWTALALLCWRHAAPGSRNRAWGLAGLAVALACATCSHFFGVLLGFPILVGEATRWLKRRQVDWPAAAVLSFSYGPVLFFIPILRAGQQVHGIHPWQRILSPGFVLNSGDLLMTGAAAPLLVCFLIAGCAGFLARAAPAPFAFPVDELAAAFALAALPVAAFCGLRMAGIHVIEEKYLITMVVGISILVAWCFYGIAGRSLWAGTAMAVVILTWGCRDFTRELVVAKEELLEAQNFRPPHNADSLGPLPVLVEKPLFATLENYAAPQVASRVYFVIDPAGREKYEGTDALDRSFQLNPRFFGPHVEAVGSFEAEHRQFLLYEKLPEGKNWMLSKYRDAGVGVELLAGVGLDRWYLVTQGQADQSVR